MKVHIHYEDNGRYAFVELTEEQLRLLEWLKENGFFDSDPVDFQVLKQDFRKI